jgi:hypothetical protein
MARIDFLAQAAKGINNITLLRSTGTFHAGRSCWHSRDTQTPDIWRAHDEQEVYVLDRNVTLKCKTVDYRSMARRQGSGHPKFSLKSRAVGHVNKAHRSLQTALNLAPPFFATCASWVSVHDHVFCRREGRGSRHRQRSEDERAACQHDRHAALRISSRPQISERAWVRSVIISTVWAGPGVKRRRSVPRGTVG